jgi:hypothetical protein
MKSLKIIIHILFYLSCVLVFIPVWIDLFSETNFKTNPWYYNLNIVMLCLVNIVDWYSVNKKIYRLALISLIAVLTAITIEIISMPGVLTNISLLLKSLGFIFMTFYFFNMLYVRTRGELAVTCRPK